MIRTLARRLEQLEAFVLPTDPPQVYIRVHFISPDGEVVKTLVLKIGHGHGRGTKRPQRWSPTRYR